MNSAILSAVQNTYAIAPTVPGPLFSTLGDSGPTALNQSEFGIGQQQRANNLYAETTFVCPSYWLASAYSPPYPGSVHFSPRQLRAPRNENPRITKQAWKYQYSVPPSEHGADLNAYQAPNREGLGEGTLSPAFRTAVQEIWGRFIIHNDPTLPSSVIKSITTLPNGTITGDDLAAAGTGLWPTWESGKGAKMLNLNMTGGHETEIEWSSADGSVRINVTQYAGPGLEARLKIVDAWGWEGGRGERCEFWRDVGTWVPE